MNGFRTSASALIACCVIAMTAPAGALAADVKPSHEFAKRASWDAPDAQTVRDTARKWLAERELDAATRAQAEALWESANTEDGDSYLLDLVVATLSAVDPQARRLAEVCADKRNEIALPDVSWLAGEAIAPFERDNLRLVYGRWLVQHQLYDEAGEQLAGLAPQDVVDPAALLFYQAVVQHRMLDGQAGTATIARLLEHEATLPKRYVSVARLMQADLEGLKPDSLDHIARRMDDIRRRLDLGRAGPKVRSVEDGVIASLDKLIEDMEKQQQAAAAAAAAQSGRGTQQPIAPLQDSKPMELKGPGETDKKNIGQKSGWGDLPPRERQEALQQISQEFPAHYRDMIEQYFRKLASEDSAPGEEKK